MEDKCPCGKCKCDCCKDKQPESDEVKLAWVRSHCKFAEPRFTRDQLNDLPSNVNKPWTPDALESEYNESPIFQRTPEQPSTTNTFLESSRLKIKELLARAMDDLENIGRQQPAHQMNNDFGDFGSATSLRMTLEDAAQQAKALEVYSHHNRQQTPAESARLGSGNASVKNAARQTPTPVPKTPLAKRRPQCQKRRTNIE